MYRVIIINFLSQFIGCFYGNSTQVNYTPISNEQFDQTYEVAIFWDGTKPKTNNYKQVAFVEAVGTYSSTAEALLYDLKKKAMALGGDAIIEVKQNYITRESGELLSELSGKSQPDKYSTITLTGVVIRFP